MITVVAGSRAIIDEKFVEKCIEDSGIEITTLIHGGAHGVDQIAAQWAQRKMIPVVMMLPKVEEPDKWFRLNRRMAESSEALIAIWDGKSEGTENMIEEAKRAHLIIKLYITSQKQLCG